MSLGTYLKNARGEKTLGQISAISGIDKGYLSKIERDMRKPKPETLRKLATAYDVDFKELVAVSGFDEPGMFYYGFSAGEEHVTKVAEALSDYQRKNEQNYAHNKFQSTTPISTIEKSEKQLVKLSDAENTLIKKYRTLDKRGKGAVEAILNNEYSQIVFDNNE